MPDAVDCEHLPTQACYSTNCSQGETPMRTAGMQTSFPRRFLTVWGGNSLVPHADSFSSCGRPLSNNVGGEAGGCGGPRLAWLRLACGCEAGWMSHSLKCLWRRLMVRKFTFASQATALVDSSSWHANCLCPQNL